MRNINQRDAAAAVAMLDRQARADSATLPMSEYQDPGYGQPCKLRDGRCLTHETADTMAHHFSANPGAYND